LIYVYNRSTGISPACFTGFMCLSPCSTLWFLDRIIQSIIHIIVNLMSTNITINLNTSTPLRYPSLSPDRDSHNQLKRVSGAFFYVCTYLYLFRYIYQHPRIIIIIFFVVRGQKLHHKNILLGCTGHWTTYYVLPIGIIVCTSKRYEIFM